MFSVAPGKARLRSRRSNPDLILLPQAQAAKDRLDHLGGDHNFCFNEANPCQKDISGKAYDERKAPKKNPRKTPFIPGRPFFPKNICPAAALCLPQGLLRTNRFSFRLSKNFPSFGLHIKDFCAKTEALPGISCRHIPEIDYGPCLLRQVRGFVGKRGYSKASQFGHGATDAQGSPVPGK